MNKNIYDGRRVNCIYDEVGQWAKPSGKIYRIGKIFYCYTEKYIGWFRLFGYGLSWKSIIKYPLLFSQKNGYTKYFKIGNWVISILKKSSF